MSWRFGLRPVGYCSIQICGHHEAGFGAGIANETQHLVIAGQRFGGPVFGNPGEQTVLDRVHLDAPAG